MSRVSVLVEPPAREMAREEIAKQITFLSEHIRNVQFSSNGDRIEFDTTSDQDAAIVDEIRKLAGRTARALENLPRKTVFRRVEEPAFEDPPDLSGVHFFGTGQVALEGIPLALFRYFDRAFEALGAAWDAKPLLTPSLIPDGVLARSGYFGSFPQCITFASHLRQDVATIQRFRQRHERAHALDGDVRSNVDHLDTCLSPAVCYHVYRIYQARTIPKEGIAHEVCGKCFRFEYRNMKDLRRLWEFTMREIIFLGSEAQVLQARDRSIEMISEFLKVHRLAGEIRTASDPFFLAPDTIAKTYFQLRSDSKFEISLLLPGDERTAAGSHNYHSDFFGRAFHTGTESGGPMHSTCVAFGLERWVYAFLAQHGSKPKNWPDVVRRAVNQPAPKSVEERCWLPD